MILDQLPDSVKIVEVGPRDGLQNEKTLLETDDKLLYITKLIESGLTNIEITSFVAPKKIPQMADSKDLFDKIKKSFHLKQFSFPCLVPNIKGMEDALAIGCKDIAVFTATSDQFNQHNINATIEESFERIAPVIKLAKKENVTIRAYISTVFGCPYEGKIPPEKVYDIVDWFNKQNVDEISLGDTTGVATPKQVDQLLSELKKRFGLEKIALHFHDTRGMALANILTSLQAGVKIFDSSSGGLGGCPYAKGATGNVATEDLVYLFNSLDIKSNVNLEKLIQASKFILDKVNRPTSSKFLQAYLNTGSY